MLKAESQSNFRPWLRGLLAGPLALAAAFLTMMGGAFWLPVGAAQVNNLVLPVVLFPLLWTACFLYACLDKKLARAYAVVGVLVILNAALIAWRMLA